MPVTLPTAADVRKVRVQAARNATERAEAARTPLLAVLGAGNAAVTAVSKAVARSRAQAEDAANRLAALPQKLNGDEARKTVDELREQAGSTYAGFAERGEKTWGKLRKQPQVGEAIARLEGYSEKLDARVDALVDDAHDVAARALALVTRQTRVAGEKTAVAAQRIAGEAAQTVTDVAGDVSERLDEAGDEAAQAARSSARKAANRTTPKASRGPAGRRTTG